ncbi:phytanoyl-CoA dioxygenase [Halioglobus sp. HI00S01]|uniref:phytanoyl-CoA dioxygenase family protein n=1 Tax=Halioglobus sp. HI00S01 TaxID=1822214 RepID=UPI0007C2468C|nr:phytanoyl-CoA dioxygenase family protein [Halioglobus sp. HI00S01]KZX60330.1 phytanoyl-CoA dioxygenase [Halioglobus sp. HI00S01]
MTTASDFTQSSLGDPLEVLQKRMADEGYLFLKQAVAAKHCNKLLADILAVAAPHVEGEAGSQAPRLVGEPFYETDAIWDQIYPRIQKLESFHRFFHQPWMNDIMARVVGPEVFVYPVKMARMATPRMRGYETPPHQDAYSHHAPPTMAGVWVALHDIDSTMGRVKVLPGSHKHGVREVFQAQGVGGVQCEIFADETHWHVSDFQQGDVLIFNSCTVHRAEPNTNEDAVRISVDTRFCDYGAPVFATNLHPHHGFRVPEINWESIYEHWQDDADKYYWRDYPNSFGHEIFEEIANA